MALYEVARTREFVLSWLEQLAGNVAFTDDAFDDMRREGADWSDVMSALEASTEATVAKENPHDAFFTLTGATCDGDILRVTVSIDPNIRGVCVHHVQR